MLQMIIMVVVGILLLVVAIMLLVKTPGFICRKFFSFWQTLILFAVFVAADAFLIMSPKTNFLKPMPLEVKRNSAIESRLSEGNVLATLKKGETVKFYGYDGLNMLVENEGGTRGYVKSYEFGLPIFDENEPDEILSFVGIKESNSDGYKDKKYVFKNQNGEEKVLDQISGKYHAVFPDGIDAGACMLGEHKVFHLSEGKFRRLYEGKNASEIDSILCPPTSMTKKEAVFTNIVAYDFAADCTYSPAVIFDGEMNVSGFAKYKAEDLGYFKYIKHLPGFRQVLDIDFFDSMLRRSIYNPNVLDLFGYDATKKWYKIAGLALFILARYGLPLAIWFFSMALPVLAMVLAAKIRFTFYFLSNKWLARLLSLVLVVSAYLWILILTANFPKFVILWIVVAAIFASLLRVLISDSFNRLFLRCCACRRMHSLKVDREELVDDWNEWRHETSEEHVGSDSIHTKDTFTENTEITKRDGIEVGRRKYKTNIKHHYTVRDKYKVSNYNVLYNFKKYKRIYKCSSCGGEEFEFYTEQKELQRNLLGTGEYTSEHEETRRGIDEF